MVIRPGFRAHHDGHVSGRLPSWLRTLLREQFGEFARLLAADSDAAPVDPLEQLTGISAGTGEPPEDPVLRRLRPDGYARDVEEGEAASDFRRFTEADLAALQRQRVAAVLESLTGGDRFDLTAEQAQEWLGALNDLRLAIGTRLEVSEDPDDAPSSDDPRRPAYEFYGLLGHLQHLLLVALGAPDDL